MECSTFTAHNAPAAEVFVVHAPPQQHVNQQNVTLICVFSPLRAYMRCESITKMSVGKHKRTYSFAGRLTQVAERRVSVYIQLE